MVKSKPVAEVSQISLKGFTAFCCLLVHGYFTSVLLATSSNLVSSCIYLRDIAHTSL